jgi:hypothetical protein
MDSPLIEVDFVPDYLFNELYVAPCRAAIASYTPHPDIQSKFISAVLTEFRLIYAQYNNGTNSASQTHLAMLTTHHRHLADIKSHRSCFCCFMRMPEKVLACGHAFCDSCIKIFGRRSLLERNTHEFPQCVLCGVYCKDSVYRFVPPTAGIRMLTIDGGGVKGVVPLMYLQYLDKSLAPIGCAVREYFDFVCGTSAGNTDGSTTFTLLISHRWSRCYWHVLITMEHERVTPTLRRDCK